MVRLSARGASCNAAPDGSIGGMSGGSISVLGTAGSLRQASYNSAVLRAVQELAPAGMTVEAFDGLATILPYSEDVKQQGFPPPVEDLWSRMEAADALLIVTPEYN
jgi:chromate reductase